MSMKLLRKNRELTNSEMMIIAPSIFAENKHQSRSDKYNYFSTFTILNLLRKEGFKPYSVAQSSSRIPGKENFTKHIIRFRKDGVLSVGEEFNEMSVLNSHDGVSACDLMSGRFRLVCENSLTTSLNENNSSYKIYHRGKQSEFDVIEAAYEIIDSFAKIDENINEMREINLTNDEQKLFASEALSLRFSDESPIEPAKLLIPQNFNDRYDPNKNKLWNTYNIIQENVIKGGISGFNKDGKRITTRKVNSIDTDLKLNKSLFRLAQEMAKLKK